MGKITINERTIKDPITFIGEVAGECYGSDVTDKKKNFKRGIDCISMNHGRPIEFPSVYLKLDGYSAKVIRELYTHIIDVSRLQASTRYITYDNFDYITPHTVSRDKDYSFTIYKECMSLISRSYQHLLKLGIPKEDASMILPLGMTTKMVWRVGLRELIDFISKRSCTRAFWEIRDICEDIKNELREYSPEWKILANDYFKTKCDVSHNCTESSPCHKWSKRSIYENRNRCR